MLNRCRVHSDPYLPIFTALFSILIALCFLSRKFKQPYAIAYLIGGVLIGPYGLNVFPTVELVEHMGSFGLIFLMFFVGMEFSPEDLFKNWKITLIGTGLQILLTVSIMYFIGYYLMEWSFNRSLLFGFVLSLSSTAVVVEFLKQKKLIDSPVGRDVLGVLVMQDIAIAPMMVVLGLINHGVSSTNYHLIALQFLGVLALGSVYYFSILLGKNRSFKNSSFFKDKESKVLGALAFALALSWFSGSVGLSSALGAFIAGGIVRTLKITESVHDSLESLRIVFLALFFVFIGLLLNLNILYKNLNVVLGLVSLVFILNTVLNFCILKLIGRSTLNSLVSAAVLSQIGEFSFLLALIGLNYSIIDQFAYDLVLIVMFSSMALTPLWVKVQETAYTFLEGQNLIRSS